MTHPSSAAGIFAACRKNARGGACSEISRAMYWPSDTGGKLTLPTITGDDLKRDIW